MPTYTKWDGKTTQNVFSTTDELDNPIPVEVVTTNAQGETSFPVIVKDVLGRCWSHTRNGVCPSIPRRTLVVKVDFPPGQVISFNEHGFIVGNTRSDVFAGKTYVAVPKHSVEDVLEFLEKHNG